MKLLFLAALCLTGSNAYGLVSSSKKSGWDKTSTVYLKSVTSRTGSYIKCTGTFVDDKTVMTAAHCLDGRDYTVIQEPESNRIRKYQGKRLYSYDLVIHHLYDPSGYRIGNYSHSGKYDIGFVKFSERSTDYFSRISFNNLGRGMKVYMEGYGHDMCVQGQLSGLGVLRYGYNNLISEDDSFLSIRGPISPSGNHEVIACHGDSGMSLQYHSGNPDSDYSWGIYGIDAYSDDAFGGHMTSKFLAFTRPEIQDFIVANVDLRHDPWAIRP